MAKYSILLYIMPQHFSHMNKFYKSKRCHWIYRIRWSQRDVIYLPNWLTNRAFVYEPKCGGGGGLRGLSQLVQHCTWSLNKLWRSNSICKVEDSPVDLTQERWSGRLSFHIQANIFTLSIQAKFFPSFGFWAYIYILFRVQANIFTLFRI